MILCLCGCGGSDNGGGVSGNKVSFEAYIKDETDSFTFEFDPAEAVSYDELRNSEFTDILSLENWEKYFEVRTVYREHIEYDDEGNPTDTYMKGDTISIILKDDYYYVDNRTRNGLEFLLHVVGEETRVMINDGITYDPVKVEYDDDRDYYGADAMIILSDFVNSWDDTTREVYTGKLDSYEMLECSGDLYLLDSSVIRFNTFKNGIHYFVAYQAPDEYFVIIIKTDDAVIEYDKEYDGAVYVTSGSRENYRYTGFDKIVLWQMITELMKEVNG